MDDKEQDRFTAITFGYEKKNLFFFCQWASNLPDKVLSISICAFQKRNIRLGFVQIEGPDEPGGHQIVADII